MDNTPTLAAYTENEIAAALDRLLDDLESVPAEPEEEEAERWDGME